MTFQGVWFGKARQRRPAMMFKREGVGAAQMQHEAAGTAQVGEEIGPARVRQRLVLNQQQGHAGARQRRQVPERPVEQARGVGRRQVVEAIRGARSSLIGQHPEHADLIRAYDARWEEMPAGTIQPSVDILAEFERAGYLLYALSNWSAEKFGGM
ncbi:MAG TPA: hypothetical protein VNO70_21875 [Blastocatellia bacterium]|nr:hypothetical protein [Blastocatellia bacterium]